MDAFCNEMMAIPIEFGVSVISSYMDVDGFVFACEEQKDEPITSE